METMKTERSQKIESARVFARRIIESKFGQHIDGDDLDAVAEKILPAIYINPARPKAKQTA